MRYVFADPTCQVFSCWIEIYDIVDIFMVQKVSNDFLYLSEINNHTFFVQFFCFAIYYNNGVMPVYVRAFALIAQVEFVGHGYFNSLFYVIHFDIYLFPSVIPIQWLKVALTKYR